MMGTFNRRAIVRRGLAGAALMAIAACVPKPHGPVTTPTPQASEEPDYSTLPKDSDRHRVALLVPLSGSNAKVGQSISNAATMALMDTNAANLRITTYDTVGGAGGAAAKALADGNRLILGPLLGDEVSAVAAQASAKNVPVISYSNDDKVTGDGVYLIGQMPAQSIARTVDYAKSQGARRFGLLIPGGEYGARAAAAFQAAVRDAGGTIVGSEEYQRSNSSVSSAARRLKARGALDAVLVPDSARIALLAGPPLKAGTPGLRVLGTELWSGEASILSSTALRGAWFSAVSDSHWKQFADSYRKRFGATPYRLAALGYDSVLLTLNVARRWKPGTTFPAGRLNDRGGFLGLDGAFRFNRQGVAERAMEVREVAAGKTVVVSPAPAKFGD